MHCDIPLTFVKIVIILWKIWRRKHPHWNSEVDFAFYMYQERKLRFKYEMFRYVTLKPLVSLTEAYESRLLSRNISYDQVLVSQKSHKLTTYNLQFITSTGMSLMFKYFTFFFKKKRIALRDNLTLQFYLPMISFHQEKKTKSTWTH